MRVAIIGTGYVGLTTGVALAYLGHRITAIDKDPEKIALLREGKSPIHEPGIESLLSQVGGRLRFEEEIAAGVPEAEIVFIAVGTPPKSNGHADLRYVEEAAREVAESFQPGQIATLVVKSTVPIGSNRRVVHIVERTLAARGIVARISFVSNPEFLREGVALRDTFFPDRIIIGSEHAETVEIMSRLYRPILEQTFTPPQQFPRPEGFELPRLITTDLTSAEMIKYAANAFLALKISYINEIAGLCEKVGADVTEVARGIGIDSRIGRRFLDAGLGWGGSCFPKDTAALVAVAEEYNYTMPIIQASREVNERQRQLIVDKLQSALKVLRGRVIGVLGLSFKPNTGDVRESPPINIIRLLIERGAHVRVHDPVAMSNARKELDGLDVEFVEHAAAVAEQADALILATEWDEYSNLDLSSMAGMMKYPLMIDGRNMFRPEEVEAAGFIYMGVGK